MSKYGSRKTVVDGIIFDSKREANRYCELRLLLKTGHIKDLRRQVKYELIPKQDGERPVFYLADFVYYDNELQKEVVEDVKGYRTDSYVIKRKLMAYIHGIKIVEV